jgi:hypothetical protein
MQSNENTISNFDKDRRKTDFLLILSLILMPFMSIIMYDFIKDYGDNKDPYVQWNVSMYKKLRSWWEYIFLGIWFPILTIVSIAFGISLKIISLLLGF